MKRAGILLTQLIRLGVVSLKDYVKFLKVTVTNPSMCVWMLTSMYILLLDHSGLAAGRQLRCDGLCGPRRRGGGKGISGSVSSSSTTDVCARRTTPTVSPSSTSCSTTTWMMWG